VAVITIFTASSYYERACLEHRNFTRITQKIHRNQLNYFTGKTHEEGKRIPHSKQAQMVKSITAGFNKTNGMKVLLTESGV
jgi:hypothetical protein